MITPKRICKHSKHSKFGKNNNEASAKHQQKEQENKQIISMSTNKQTKIIQTCVQQQKKQHERHKHYRHAPPNRHTNEPAKQISSIFLKQKSDQSECAKMSGKWRHRDRRDTTSGGHKQFCPQASSILLKKLSSQF